VSYSAIYEGIVDHHRLRPREHRFRYDVGHVYLDLDELPGVLDAHPLWSARRLAPACFREADYFGRGRAPLAEAIRDTVARHAGERPTGPIRLLTHPRYWGWCFNPVSFYYVFEPDGETLRWFVADVTNTPWGERHAYVLGPVPDSAQGEPWHPTSAKVFHVSPFMEMDMEYRWTIQTPGEKLVVRIDNHDATGKLFSAGVTLRRRPLDGPNLGRLLWRYPWLTAKVVGGIHWQALRLWLKRIPYVPHPGTKEPR
jgi:DUF1365 family protein